MDLEEHPVATDRRRGAGEIGNHGPVAPGTPDRPPGQLHTVRGIEQYRDTERAHHRQGLEINDKAMIAERGAPLGDDDARAAAELCLLDDVADVLRR